MTAYRPDAYAIFDLMEMSEYADPDTDYQAEAEHLAGLYRDLPEPIPLWRVVRCDSEQQCDLEMPGYHWSFDRDAVIAYAERDLGSPVYLLSAQVSSADVYWEGTVASYVEHPEEYEITPFDDSKLQNLSVETRVAVVSTPGLRYRGRQYRLAADPQRDEKFRQRAVAAYDKLIQRCKAREVEPVDAVGEEDVPDGTTVGWLVRDLEPRLNVVLRPLAAGSQTYGQYHPGARHSPVLITLYNGDWGGNFWQSEEDHQQQLLPYAFPRRTFLHEYIHHLDWTRAPNISYGKHKTIDKMTAAEYAAYLSEPAEFNAWFQSYADDIERELQLFVEKVPARFWKDKHATADRFVARFIQSFQADGWRIDILPAKLQRKIKKRLAQMFLHLWRDPEPATFDVHQYLEDLARKLWGVMEDSVEGWDYMDDPDGVERRFDQIIGATFEDFLAQRHAIWSELSGSQSLAVKTGLRQIYQTLQEERDTIVAAGRRKVK